MPGPFKTHRDNKIKLMLQHNSQSTFLLFYYFSRVKKNKNILLIAKRKLLLTHIIDTDDKNQYCYHIFIIIYFTFVRVAAQG